MGNVAFITWNPLKLPTVQCTEETTEVKKKKENASPFTSVFTFLQSEVVVLKQYLQFHTIQTKQTYKI